MIAFRAADPKGTMSCRIQGESVHTSVCWSVHPCIRSPPPQPASLWRALGRWRDGRTDGWTYAQIPPVFYRTSSPLGLLPCLLHHCHCKKEWQGKGTADHILPVGDWFLMNIFIILCSIFHVCFCAIQPYTIVISSTCILHNRACCF